MKTSSILENIAIEVKNHTLYLTIAREDKMNALNLKTIEEIKEVFENLQEDKDIKGVIITGEGTKAFIAGADISEFGSLNEVNGRKYSEIGQEVFDLIENSSKPVIAAINGFALGGGCELAMACHLRVAVSNAKFGQPEVNLGLIPGYGGTQRLTRLIGKGKAIELLMTGDFIDANQAFALGLINHLVDSKEALILKCEEILGKIYAKAPLAVGMIIECVNAVYNNEEKGYQIEANNFSICCKTLDFKEGVKAFLEKRKPEFRGI